MNQLVTTAILTSLAIGIVATTVIFLIWRSPFLKNRSKWITTIIAIIIFLLLVAGLTFGLNKYMTGSNKKPQTAGKEPKGDFLYGYDVLEYSKLGTKSVKVAVLVSDRISKKDLELEIKQALRDFSFPGSRIEVSAYSKRQTPLNTSQSWFVCKASSLSTGPIKWLWNPDVALPGERTKF